MGKDKLAATPAVPQMVWKKSELAKVVLKSLNLSLSCTQYVNEINLKIKMSPSLSSDTLLYSQEL